MTQKSVQFPARPHTSLSSWCHEARGALAPTSGAFGGDYEDHRKKAREARSAQGRSLLSAGVSNFLPAGLSAGRERRHYN